MKNVGLSVAFANPELIPSFSHESVTMFQPIHDFASAWPRCRSRDLKKASGRGMYVKIESLGVVLSGSLSAVSKPNVARK